MHFAPSFLLSLLITLPALPVLSAPPAASSAAPAAAQSAEVASSRPESLPFRHDLMPAPARLVPAEGRLALDTAFTVALKGAGASDARLKPAAERWIKRLEKRSGKTFPSPWAPPDKAVLVIECGKATPPGQAGQPEQPGKAAQPAQSAREDESYRINVDGRRATLSAPNALGVLRGLETLLQWLDPGAQVLGRQGAGPQGRAPGWPAVAIEDKPRFPWRGLLIDVSRHFHSVEVLKRNLDGMAEAKLNVLHWHLSDDQGFRVESRKFPKLHGMGSDGNFYTQDQIKEVLAYARERGIRVMPEFDLPGHATSWLVGHPELAAGPGPYVIERRFGIFNPTLDPTREANYEFLDAFVGEMAALFPDRYFHIGGDEVTGREWNSNPSIQAFMNSKGMKSNGDLQVYFNSRMAKILAKHGKKMAGWDEIAHPDLPRDILVQNWRGTEGLARGARAGKDGILSNGYYLDLMHPAASHYAMDPIPKGSDLDKDIDERARDHVLGGEACMWSEYTSSETIDSRIWPRLMAVAERLWSPAETKDTADMYRRMEIASARLEDHGLTHRSNYRPMLARLVGDQGAASLQVLADAVIPVKGYGRGSSRLYTSLFPLDRLVDAVRPESEAARRFQAGVDALLSSTGNPGAASVVAVPGAAIPRATPIPYQADIADSLRVALQRWKANHATLGPLLLKSPAAQEAYPQSRDLSEAARLGLEALEFLRAGRQAPGPWREAALRSLDRARLPRAEVEIAMVPAARKLVLAAGSWDALKALAAVDRTAALKTLADAPIGHDGH